MYHQMFQRINVAHWSRTLVKDYV